MGPSHGCQILVVQPAAAFSHCSVDLSCWRTALHVQPENADCSLRVGQRGVLFHQNTPSFGNGKASPVKPGLRLAVSSSVQMYDRWVVG